MTNITKGIRLLFPIKDMAHGEAVQDLLFANRERSFESITFLHVVDKDLMGDPAYSAFEAIKRMRGHERSVADSRAFLRDLVARTQRELDVENVDFCVLSDHDVAGCILRKADQLCSTMLILLADNTSLQDNWFNTSVLKVVLRKTPDDLTVHVIKGPVRGGFLASLT